MSHSDETSSEVRQFLQNLNDGNDSAIGRLYERYLNDLQALAARRMSPQIDGGPESVAMSVMGSILRGIRGGRFEFESTRKLWNLLVTITLNKIRSRAAKGGGRRPVAADLSAVLEKGPDREAVAVVHDVIEAALGGLESPFPQILAMRLEGFKRREIAERLEMTDGAVKFKLERIKERLDRLLSQS